MRRQFLLSLLSVVLIAKTPLLPLSEAEGQYLDAWDLQDGKGSITAPSVSPADRPALTWLENASHQKLPANPFPKGRAWREAQAVRAFLQSPRERWAKELPALPLSLSGSYLALWRWGQPRVRAGQMEPSLRHAWEDRLSAGPPVVRFLAVRHALCFALAEADEPRFADLKTRLEDTIPDLFPNFQNAFSLLGAPAPVVHLWTLPQMESVDIPLNQLGAARVRFDMDPGQGIPALPPDTVWIVPTKDGSQPDSSSYLDGASLAEAQNLVPRLKGAQRTAYLAPVRNVFETYALMFFPIDMAFNPDGTVRSIVMGDAARAKESSGAP